MKKPEWWLRIKSKVTNNNLYIWFIGRPMHNAPDLSYYLYCLAIFFAIAAVIISNNFFDNYVTLDKMNQENVVVLGATYTHGGRAGTNTLLRFETKENVEKKYRLATPHKAVVEKINGYRGKKAKIWVDQVYQHVDSYYLIYQVEVGGELLLRYRYSSSQEVREANSSGNTWASFLVVSSVFISIALVAYIVLNLGIYRSK